MPAAADTTALIDAFLILEQPRQRLSHWSHALAALDSTHAPPLAGVTAYYDPQNDQALLALRYDELALGGERLAYVVEVALLAEIGMIQPAELSDGERRRFLGERLARCVLEVGNQRTAVAALGELVRLLKGVPKPAAARTSTALADALPLRAPTPTPIGVRSARAERPPRLPAGALRTRSTRDDLAALAKPLPVPVAYEDSPVISRGTRDLPKPPARHLVARAPTPMPPASEPDDAMPQLPQMPTMPLAPEAMRRARSPGVETEPYLPPNAGAPDTIYARYLRSGRWVPIRIGSLSLKGAALLAGALPRTQDFVDVALSFGGHRALVRGAVSKISSLAEAQSSGAATFSVDFALDEAARRQLTALLTAARAAKVTIKPPPPRAARRLPVQWPVCLGTMRGAVRSEALDVSRGGMFVRPTQPLVTNTCINFSAVLDDGAGPVAGRARVVRHVTDAEALACGLVAGYGLRVLDMNDADLPRWYAFLGRVEQRADRRVLVGASPARLAELQATLAAAGYAVTGGTDPGALVQLASTDARPVDCAMIDGTWLGEDAASASWFETLFSARNVPCLTLHGDARRARASIDKVLAIS